MTEKFNKYLYYGIIVVISLMTLFLVPMLGSELGLEWKFPDTVAGWIVYAVSTIISTVLNLLMFHAFVKQGKINVKEDINFKKANSIIEALHESKNIKQGKPKSPAEWHKKEYLSKAISLAFFTLLGTVGLANALLSFDLAKFLAQAICLVSGIVFGFIEMKTVEEYWTTQYYQYALYLEAQSKEEKNNVQVQ